MIRPISALSSVSCSGFRCVSPQEAKRIIALGDEFLKSSPAYIRPMVKPSSLSSAQVIDIDADRLSYIKFVTKEDTIPAEVLDKFGYKQFEGVRD